MAHFGKAWECFFKMEVILIAFVREFVEFGFVGLEMLDKVYEVTGLLELLQILSVNHIPELVFDPDNEFDCVERVETMVNKLAIESNTRLFGCAEVVLHDG